MKADILLINPPIYDFAAYDFWLKPYGLLQIGGFLRASSNVKLFDFMDRLHPELSKSTASDPFGRGHYSGTQVTKPEVFKDIPRRYYRFGVARERFQDYLAKTKRIDIALIGSTMTYWYPGIREVIEDLRRYHPETKIAVGGLYPTLCPEHAKHLNADLLVFGSRLETLWKHFNLKPDLSAPPFWEGYQNLEYGVIKLTDGCPLNCSYCATKTIHNGFSIRSLKHSISELKFLADRGVSQIAFYDDALIMLAKEALLPFLEASKNMDIKFTFHTPNAIHLRAINQSMADTLIKHNFKKLFFGYESVSTEWLKNTGPKNSADELSHAVKALKLAGARADDLTAYIILGHPKHHTQQIEIALKYANSLGIKVMLSDYSPVPGTADGELCRKWVDLNEPLWHNKTAFPIKLLGDAEVQRIKQISRVLNIHGDNQITRNRYR